MSKFARLGRIRSCSQSVSYEVRIALFFIALIILIRSIKILISENFFMFFIFLPLLFFWFLSCLAETNRAPFDFSEGERELISGFNIEFRGVPFTLLFLAEYGIIIFFSFFTSYLFFNFLFFFSSLVLFLFLLIRRVYPRFRYDKLIRIT